MCLFTDSPNGMTSEGTVICYKGHIRSQEKYVSPIMRKPYTINPGDEIVAEEEMVAEDYFNGFQWDFYCISKGAIHAYRSIANPVDAIISYVSLPDLKDILFSKIRERNFNEADETLRTIIKSLKEQCAVCEMEIPIGEPYYLGLFGDICSHKMIFKNEIDIGDVAEDYILQQILKSDDIYDEEVTLEYNRYRRRKRIRKERSQN